MPQSDVSVATGGTRNPQLVSDVDPAIAAAPGFTGPPLLLQVWQSVVRWKWAIIGIVLAALATGLVVTSTTTKQYTATSRVEISRQAQNISNVEGIESEQVGQAQEFFNTQYALLKSRSLAQRVARRLRLNSNSEFAGNAGATPPATQDAAATASGPRRFEANDGRMRSATSRLLANVTIRPVTGSALVDIAYKSPSPELSARIANAWAEEFIAASVDKRFGASDSARRLLEGQLNELRDRVETSERELVAYAGTRDIVTIEQSQSPDGRTLPARTLVAQELDSLNEELIRATSARIAAQAAYRESGEAVSNSALNNPALASLRQRRTELNAEYARLLVQFEPQYPLAQGLARQIEALDAAIEREQSRNLTGLRGNYDAARSREAQLSARVDALKGRFVQQRNDTIEFNNLQREVDTSRQLYDALLQRFKEIGVAGVEPSSISIIDQAQVPTAPSEPRLALNLLLALLVGIGLSGAVVFALESVDEGLRNPADVPKLLGYPLLGSTPDSGEQNVIETLNDPKSQLVESYLAIRSNLAISTDHGMPRVLMMTSTRKGEGKSTTSFALALMIKRSGKSVILVDADLRAPSVDTIANVDNANGLTQYLAGTDDWRSSVVRSPGTELEILPSGPRPPNAAELLSSDRIDRLVGELLTHYDHVVIDAPPILGLADAPLLSRVVEALIFVVEAEGVAVRGLRNALGRLQAVQAPIKGVVVTKLTPRAAEYVYGYGYDYGYGYGKSGQAGMR